MIYGYFITVSAKTTAEKTHITVNHYKTKLIELLDKVDALVF